MKNSLISICFGLLLNSTAKAMDSFSSILVKFYLATSAPLWTYIFCKNYIICSGQITKIIKIYRQRKACSIKILVQSFMRLAKYSWSCFWLIFVKLQETIFFVQRWHCKWGHSCHMTTKLWQNIQRTQE